MEEEDLVILIPYKGNPKIYSRKYSSLTTLEYENNLPSHSQYFSVKDQFYCLFDSILIMWEIKSYNYAY